MIVEAMIINAALLVGAFLVGLVLRRGPRRRCLLVSAVGLAVCLAKAALVRRPDIETRLFPWPNYVLFSDWNGMLAMLVVGAMAGLVRRRREWLWLGAAGVLTFGYFLDHLRWVGTTASTGLSPRSQAALCPQTTPYTCSAAAAASIGEMAALCLTRENRGTLDLGLYRGLNLKLRQVHADLGVRVDRLTFDELLEAPKPCLLRVRFGADHTVVVLFALGREVVVFDPSMPDRLLRWDRHTLIEQAGWGGYAFVLYRLDGHPLPQARNTAYLARLSRPRPDVM
jgi:hypothetical protein